MNSGQAGMHEPKGFIRPGFRLRQVFLCPDCGAVLETGLANGLNTSSGSMFAETMCASSRDCPNFGHRVIVERATGYVIATL